MPKVFLPVLRDQIGQAISKDATIKRLALVEARSIFDAAEKELYRSFDEHLVTKELKQAKGESLSGAITGPPGANLFSYIGFYNSPIPELRKLIKSLVTFRGSSSKVVKQTTGLALSVTVEIPVNADLYKETPFPEWKGGISWLKGIESYISGVHQYLTRDSVARNQSRRILANSRSTQAIQIKGQLKTPAVFAPQSYITKILSDFRSKFRGKGGRFV